MKKHTALPALLAVWPYLFVLFLMLPIELPPEFIGNFFAAHNVLTVLVYGANVWCALCCPVQDPARWAAFWDRTIKLAHIPFYMAVFAAGTLALLTMVVPALVFVSPLFVLTLTLVDLLLMAVSSMYGARAALELARQGTLPPRTALLHTLAHFLFVADVVSSLLLYRTAKGAAPAPQGSPE